MATDAPVKFSPQLTQQFAGNGLAAYANVVDQNLLRLKKAIDDANATFVDQRATINRLIQTINISAAAAKQVPQMPGFDTGEDGGDPGTIILGSPGARGRDGISLPGQDGDDGDFGLPGPSGRAGRDGVAVFLPDAGEDQAEPMMSWLSPPAITWPAAARVLVSSGTTTVPVGNSAFQFDQATRVLYMGAGSSQSWSNLNDFGAGTYERVTASWIANVFTMLSESAGGTVRDMTLDASTGTLTLAGATSKLSASAGTVTVTASSVAVAIAVATGRVSAAGATLNAVNVAGSTIQVTGATNITTAAGFNYMTIGQPTYSGVSVAKTVTSAATVSIVGPPIAASSLTITNAYALWVQSGISRFDGNGTHVFELPADATVAGAQTGRIPIKVGGATVYLHYFNG